jgi:hypothetical protein
MMSDDYYMRTFVDTDDLSDTALVTSNPFSDGHDLSHLGHVDEVWRDCWNGDQGTILAETVFRVAADFWNNRPDDIERMVVWAMQPHVPFIDSDIGTGYDSGEEWGGPCSDAWELVETGAVERETAWEAYADNLRYVLHAADEFSTTVDADKLVITSDHGNAIGEWGIYGHPPTYPLRCLTEVPWIELTATSTRNPQTVDRDSRANLDEQLAALGYK